MPRVRNWEDYCMIEDEDGTTENTITCPECGLRVGRDNFMVMKHLTGVNLCECPDCGTRFKEGE